MKVILAIMFFCLYPLSVQANGEVWDVINQWSRVGFSQAYVVYPDKNTKSFQAMITDDPDGKQIVEIRFYDSKYDRCNNSIGLSDVVVKVNGKRVKMKAGCRNIHSVKLLRYFAVTDKGRSHIIKSFQSGKPVPITMQGYDFEIPSEGFTAAWDNYGGDAI